MKSHKTGVGGAINNATRKAKGAKGTKNLYLKANAPKNIQKRKKYSKKEDMIDMIQLGIVKAGPIKIKYRGEFITNGLIREDGTLSSCGKNFQSPSGFALYFVQKVNPKIQTINGYTYIFQGNNSLDQLRNMYYFKGTRPSTKRMLPFNCERCRLDKTRCDKTWPKCRQCIRKGFDCVSVAPKRGRPTKAESHRNRLMSNVSTKRKATNIPTSKRGKVENLVKKPSRKKQKLPPRTLPQRKRNQPNYFKDEQARQMNVDSSTIEDDDIFSDEDDDDDDSKEDQILALMMAVEKEHFQVVKYLIEQGGADPNITDSMEMNALHHAAITNKKDTKVIDFLLTNMSPDSINKKVLGKSPLQWASKYNKGPIVQEIIACIRSKSKVVIV